MILLEKLEECPGCGEVKKWLYDAQICAACGHGNPQQEKDMTSEDNNIAEEPSPPEWAVVEIMGHREHAGLIAEVSRFGTALLEVREYGTEDAEPYRVHQYGGASIFSVTPCTEEYARKTCDQKWRWSRGGKTTPLLEWERDDDEDDHGFDPEDHPDPITNAAEKAAVAGLYSDDD